MDHRSYPKTDCKLPNEYLYGSHPHSGIHYHPYGSYIFCSRRSEILLNTEEAQDELVKAARILVYLMDNPNPGLFTWNESCQKAYDKIKESVFVIEQKQ